MTVNSDIIFQQAFEASISSTKIEHRPKLSYTEEQLDLLERIT